jgi:hypothetical protein
MAAGALDAFVADYFAAHDGPPLPVGLDLAQHLVFGAIEYARSLGFEPHRDLDLVVDHLGSGPRAPRSPSAATGSPCTARVRGTTPPRSWQR